MSDTSQSPGWWQASDGKWYPPHLHPNYVAQTQQTYQAPMAAPPPRRSHGFVIAIVSAVVLLVLVGVGVGIYMAAQASAIGPGSGTATISWQPVGAGSVNSDTGGVNDQPQPFTGSIEGIGVSGTARFVIPGNASALSESSIPLQRYTGSFDGKSFNLEVTVSLSRSGATSSTAPTDAGFVVNGTWGSDNVHAVITAPTNTNSNTADFRGTIGQWKVTGTITGPANGATSKGTASFTVSQ
jgi:hypothetical protein